MTPKAAMLAKRLQNLITVSRWSGIPVPVIVAQIDPSEFAKAHRTFAAIARSLEPRA
jgi:hypothetical protein